MLLVVTGYIACTPSCIHLVHVQTASNILLAAAKSVLTHRTENSRNNRVIKIDIPLVIDVNKN